DLAAALTAVTADPDRAAAMGEAGRARAVQAFGWDTVADQTRAVYAAAAIRSTP
nr:glycogen synthase [Actinomycetota bacterium]